MTSEGTTDNSEELADDLQLSDHIDDEEWLYRSFPVPDERQNGAIHYQIIDGVLRLGRGVWNDRVTLQPSVDRKILLTSAEEVRFNEIDAVVQIQAKEIRAISGTIPSKNGGMHDHDVKYDPTKDRPAHSRILSSPPFSDKPTSEYKKWKEFQRLLSLAASTHGFVIEPQIKKNA